MKKYLFSFLLMLSAALVVYGETYSFTGVNLAANSTNSTASETFTFGDSEGLEGFRFFLNAKANAGTTNGNLTVIALTSPDGVIWDSPYSSTNSGLVKIILTASGTAVAGGTNGTSDFYAGYGIRKMKLIYQNSAPGSWSNVVASFSYRQK